VSLHQRERMRLSGDQKTQTKKLLDKVWAEHDRKKTALAARHRQQMDAQRAAQRSSAQERVSYAEARSQLAMEREGVVPPRQAAMAPAHETDLQYVARIRQEMAAHAERNIPKRPRIVAEPPSPEPVSAPPPRVSAAPPFGKAAEPAPERESPAPLSRSEQIKRDMEAWRTRNPGRDLGREL
jgi:hypothetical protein